MFEVVWMDCCGTDWSTVVFSVVLIVSLLFVNRKNLQKIFSLPYVLTVLAGYLLLSYYFREMFSVYFPDTAFYLPGILLTICLIGLLGAVVRMIQSAAVFALWLATVFLIISPFLPSDSTSHLMARVSDIHNEAEAIIAQYPQIGERMKTSAGKVRKFWQLMLT